MTSKKPASSKRVTPPRACDYVKTFLEDWERLSRSGRYDLRRLKEAMLLLIANAGSPSPPTLEPGRSPGFLPSAKLRFHARRKREPWPCAACGGPIPGRGAEGLKVRAAKIRAVKR
jgi:hypothetical protein